MSSRAFNLNYFILTKPSFLQFKLSIMTTVASLIVFCQIIVCGTGSSHGLISKVMQRKLNGSFPVLVQDIDDFYFGGKSMNSSELKKEIKETEDETFTVYNLENQAISSLDGIKFPQFVEAHPVILNLEWNKLHSISSKKTRFPRPLHGLKLCGNKIQERFDLHDLTVTEFDIGCNGIASLDGFKLPNAAPTPIPVKPCSVIGVSITLLSPNFSKRP